MNQKDDHVSLNSPIPWVGPSGLSGFISSISPTSLALKAFQPDQPNIQANYIKVMLGPERDFLFHGSVRLIDGGIPEFIVDDDHLPILHDLLGQIRKNQHIEICQHDDVESSDKYTGFQDIQFTPEALPELDINQLDTASSLLGRRFDFPILITGMTGGVDKGTLINSRLAALAAEYNIPMGVGSQRIALDNPDYANIFHVKRQHPGIFLMGNLGFAQLRAANYLDLCQRAVDMIEADALAIHLNVIQEAIQVEGDRSFLGALDRLAKLCEELSVPVIVKEVGSGISANTARRLFEVGVSVIDVGGRGGTSWGYIEGLRSSSPQTKSLANSFRDWGIPTAFAVCAARHELPQASLIATGGIRDGLTVAKAVALGANFAGIGLPFLRAALLSEQELHNQMEVYVRGLKIAMIGSGCRSLSELKQKICLGHPMQRHFEQIVTAKGSY
ncbi:MAG: type 2 isopentenyl-diphosphate Delta-isomerase [Pseudobacteriovorax sp.]|nr:type 2 isopentenyl-diphosphate Delta-isomerase [Pseudobacteriovorax sp.]